MDGDVRVCRNGFRHLRSALEQDQHAHAAMGFPASGRSMKSDREEQLEFRGLVAGLYALRGGFVASLQTKGVRLPIGLEGNDGFLGALVKWDLEPKQDWDPTRLVPCPDAGFEFESMSHFRPADWRAYFRRKVRYAHRLYENRLLHMALKKDGLEGIPENIKDLYRHSSNFRLRWHGLDTIFHWLVLRKIRRNQ